MPDNSGIPQHPYSPSPTAEMEELHQLFTNQLAIEHHLAETDIHKYTTLYRLLFHLVAQYQLVTSDLNEAQQRIVTTWESMTDAFVSLDLEWRFTYVNQAAINVITHLTDVPESEILSKTHWEIFPELLGGEVEAKYQQAITEQTPQHFEVRYEPTGNWFEIHAYPSAIGLGIYFQDISKRKTAEEKVLRTESRLRYLLSANPAILYACQASGDYAATYISDNVSVVFGYTSQDFLADNKFWANRIHPDDVTQVFDGLTHLFEAGTHKHEYRFLHQNGSYLWVLDELKLIRDDNGNPLEIVGYWIDITERKVAEQKISEQANLLAIATDAIYVHDLNNQIIFWNQGAERLYECPAEEMIGEDWRQLLNPSESPSEPGDWQGEVSKRTQSGREVMVMSRRSAMYDADGQIKSILTVDTDITDKKQLESQFLRAQRLESLGMLASGIAHDLNNVLTPIIGIVQLLPLKITNIDPQTQRLLQILEESSQRGANLVKQILSFTRGIEGKPTNIHIGHLIAETQKIIQETFPKNIDLLINLPADLWLTAADATLLHQVFLNLCVNARDAMPDGGQLEIVAENLEIDENYAQMNIDATPGAYVAVTISDTGIGISPKVIDQIFDPFFTTKEIGKGTGLGLSTVIGVVKSHKGFISVYSEPAKGTKFKVYLPATEDSILAEESFNSPLFGQGELILVVDDELSVREVTKATLETHGYQTILASDGIEAIALYAEQKLQISAVLLDLMMPLLDSVTIARTLRKLNPEVKIIAMSGLSTNESVTKVMEEGVKHFIAKPFTAQEILLPLTEICARDSE